MFHSPEMDINDIKTSSIVRFLFPYIPFIAKTALWHTLWLSPTSTKRDLKTELIINVSREVFKYILSFPISKQQAITLKDPGIKGKIWISKITLPMPEVDSLQKALIATIDELKEGKEKYTVPTMIPVEAEWTGYQADANSESPRLELSEAQHYDRLMAEVTSDVTILYLHGGAFYLCDPCTHRIHCSKLARLTGGRCLSVRYRLAPQHPFPAALLDAFLAYVSLLSPSTGDFHTPVNASKIVICGDSAGGGLALSLLQLLLHLNRSKSTVRFHNRDVPIALPAGVAVSSAWTDVTRCMPSTVNNATYDYLPLPPTQKQIASIMPCNIWPTEPFRGNLYCDTTISCHPLVSPVAAADWRGSCPIWLGYGQEMLLDDGKYVAAQAAQQGVNVVWEEWEAMPHAFAFVLEGIPQTKKFFTNWAAFCSRVVDQGEKGIRTQGTWFAAKGERKQEVDVQALGVMSGEEVRQTMKRAREAKEAEEAESLIDDKVYSRL